MFVFNSVLLHRLCIYMMLSSKIYWKVSVFIQGIFCTQESNLGLLSLLHWQVNSFTAEQAGKPIHSSQLWDITITSWGGFLLKLIMLTKWLLNLILNCWRSEYIICYNLWVQRDRRNSWASLSYQWPVAIPGDGIWNHPQFPCTEKLLAGCHTIFTHQSSIPKPSHENDLLIGSPVPPS